MDYRRLNSQIVSDAYPLPDLLKRVNGAKVFSTLDLNFGYWQCEVEEKSTPMSTFVTPRGVYQCKVMSFGLKNAPATFTHFMDKVLSVYIGDFC